MKKIKIISLVTASIFVLLCAVPAVQASGSVKDEIPYVNNDIPGFTGYSNKSLNVYTEENGAAAGVPEGYTGYVIKLTGVSQNGLALDFTPQRIPYTIVSSVDARIYYPSNTVQSGNGVRFTQHNSADWALLDPPDYPDQWTVVSVKDSSMIKKMSNEDGFMGKFGFGLRYGNGNSGCCYIDYIKVTLKPDDKKAPALTYNGPTDITVSAGIPFSIDATAYDEAEKRNVPLDYKWSSADALDADGNLVEGTYTCAVSASDYYGNKSEEIMLNVTVTPRDTEPPVIHFDLTEIDTVAGCKPVIDVRVSDNQDGASLKLIWSSGALDNRGRLKAGDHTLILRAIDSSGNRTEKTAINFISRIPNRSEAKRWM